jgi:UDP-glucose 4-epimerase
MTILVTGGAGYLGSALIRRLPKMDAFRGETVRVLDNMFRERYVSLWDLPPKAHYEFLEGDVREAKDVRKALADVEIVFSLSDITNAPVSFERKDLTWETNHKGVLNLFNESVHAGVTKFVYTSTCSVYGPTDGVVDETAVCHPVSPYAESKFAAETEMQRKAKECGFNWTALRLGTVYGWSVGIRFDTIINRFAYLAAQGRPLTVYDTAWQEKRPYLGVADVMTAYGIAATSNQTKGQILNVVGENANMERVVNAIKAVLPKVQVTTTKTPSLNQLSYEVDCSRIRAMGFQPKVSIPDGVAELLEKFRGIASVSLPKVSAES